MNLIEYKNPEFSIRSVQIDGDPWFVAKDVCAALGVANSRDAVTSLHDDERSDVAIADTRSKGGTTQSRSMTVINESGLYALIFQSRKPEAQVFRRWVTGEVLPAIRRDGIYRLRALDMQRIKELEASVAGARQSLEKKVAAYWRAQEIEGQCTMQHYLYTCGLKLTVQEAGAVNSRVRSMRADQGWAPGFARERRQPKSAPPNASRRGWQRFRTWPTDCLASALRQSGYEFREPTTEDLAATLGEFRAAFTLECSGLPRPGLQALDQRVAARSLNAAERRSGAIDAGTVVK